MSPRIDFVFSYGIGGRRRRHTVSRPSTVTWKEVLAEMAEAGWHEVRAVRREWPSYAWPGGYPIFYVTKDAAVLSALAANQELARTLDPHDDQFFVISQQINFEDQDLWCEHLNERIPAAYELDEQAPGSTS